MNSILFEALIIGLVLCADSFSAALAMGARPHKFSDSLKFAFSSGSAEALVAFLGAIMGLQIIAKFDAIDHWIAFIILLVVALHMGLEGFSELKNPSPHIEKKFHGFIKILIVSFATSLDAFAVGISLGATKKILLPFIISIGLWAFFSTLIGMAIAKKASSKLGPIFNIIAFIILLSLAFKILWDGLQ